jgi:hypothetical protein
VSKARRFAATKTKIKPRAAPSNENSSRHLSPFGVSCPVITGCGPWAPVAERPVVLPTESVGSTRYGGHEAFIAREGLAVRAEEILIRAETMSDEDARQMMRGVAASYEKLASQVEQQADEA